MPKPEFVYTTYIHTTPERLWRALTDPAFTQRYLGAALESDWQIGSPITFRFERGAVTVADPEQIVLESDPYRRLAFTWQTFTPEWATAYEISEEWLAAAASEPRSKVSFDLEPIDRQVKLTVAHSGFRDDSTVLKTVGQGWPRILSELKTLLEADDEHPAGSYTRSAP